MSSAAPSTLPQPPPLADFVCSRLPHFVGEAKQGVMAHPAAFARISSWTTFGSALPPVARMT